MGGRREVSIIFYRPVTRSDLKQERSFFRGSVSSFLQLVVGNGVNVTMEINCIVNDKTFHYMSSQVKCWNSTL